MQIRENSETVRVDSSSEYMNPSNEGTIDFPIVACNREVSSAGTRIVQNSIRTLSNSVSCHGLETLVALICGNFWVDTDNTIAERWTRQERHLDGRDRRKASPADNG